ncbi:hypothetical protein FB451DRAFT_362886 [Mycena latifolia]|nr:hypothetical protein FB451DRAFT_362886 [Mycena latifolia]
MRPTALFSVLLLTASALAAPSAPSAESDFGRGAYGISRRQSIQCAPADDDGVPLSGSAPSGDFVSCEYDGGAGECTYFPAEGSFSSGSSQCPPGVAQDPSASESCPSFLYHRDTVVARAPPPPRAALPPLRLIPLLLPRPTPRLLRLTTSPPLMTPPRRRPKPHPRRQQAHPRLLHPQ